MNSTNFRSKTGKTPIIVRHHYENKQNKYQQSLNGTLIEVYEGSRSSDKCTFSIVMNFKAISSVRINDYF